MIAISLQSGSNGNCVYVETADARLLFDAGVTGVVTASRLAEFGRDIQSVDAVVISHDHVDHIRYAGVLNRKFDLPVWVTEKTLSAAQRKMDLGELRTVETFKAGQALSFGETRIRTIPTPHDAIDGVAFVVSSEGKRLGILTDLGHVFDNLVSVMGSLDGVILESNYDPDMLSRGPYPRSVRQRIRGPKGHLSNEEAATLVRDHASSRLQWVCLAHLSEENNDMEVALSTHRRVLGRRFPLHVAGRYGSSRELKL